MSVEDMTAIIDKYGVQKTVTILKREGIDEDIICRSLLLLDEAGDHVQNPGAWLRCAARDGYERNPAMARKAAAKAENKKLQDEMFEQLINSGRPTADDIPSGRFVHEEA